MYKAVSLVVLLAATVLAESKQMLSDLTIANYGPVAAVPGRQAIDPEASFKISFDLAQPAKVGELNRSIESAARFINMQVAAGTPKAQINLAVVVHGGAVKDMTSSAVYQNSHGQTNANQDLIEVLQQHGVKFYVCGQSAAYYGVEHTQLVEGVTMSLSAMTAHALLQQQGYTLNPF